MKKFLFIPLLSVLLAGTAAPQTADEQEQEEELVIELQGEQSPTYPTITIWDKTAPQLANLLRNKTRTYALYSIENVSTKDGIIQSENGQKYAFVQYGSDSADYRKFIFLPQDPQTFVAAAADAADVLAIHKKYGVNLGLTKAAFLKLYPVQSTQTDITDEATGITLEIFRASYTDADNKTPHTRWFAFENGKLSRTFESQEAFNKFQHDQASANLKTQEARLKQQQAQVEQQRLQNQKDAQKLRRRRPPFKALVSGGTLQDRMYMPRVLPPPAKPEAPQKQTSARK